MDAQEDVEGTSCLSKSRMQQSTAHVRRPISARETSSGRGQLLQPGHRVSTVQPLFEEGDRVE